MALLSVESPWTTAGFSSLDAARRGAVACFHSKLVTKARVSPDSRGNSPSFSSQFSSTSCRYPALTQPLHPGLHQCVTGSDSFPAFTFHGPSSRLGVWRAQRALRAPISITANGQQFHSRGCCLIVSTPPNSCPLIRDGLRVGTTVDNRPRHCSTRTRRSQRPRPTIAYVITIEAHICIRECSKHNKRCAMPAPALALHYNLLQS